MVSSSLVIYLFESLVDARALSLFISSIDAQLEKDR